MNLAMMLKKLNFSNFFEELSSYTWFLPFESNLEYNFDASLGGSGLFLDDSDLFKGFLLVSN